MTVRVKVVGGTGIDTEFKISPGSVITLGRSDPANVRVHDSRCSRKHCRLRYREGRLRVEDLESRNGTFVNGRRIEGESVLASGDTLRIGRCEMLFTHVADEDAKGLPPPPPAGKVRQEAVPTKMDEPELPLVIPIVESEAAPRFCPVCSREVEERAASCPSCETEFQDRDTAPDLPVIEEGEAFFCPICGGEVPGAATHCPQCETEFTGSSAS